MMAEGDVTQVGPFTLTEKHHAGTYWRVMLDEFTVGHVYRIMPGVYRVRENPYPPRDENGERRRQIEHDFPVCEAALWELIRIHDNFMVYDDAQHVARMEKWKSTMADAVRRGLDG